MSIGKFGHILKTSKNNQPIVLDKYSKFMLKYQWIL